VDQKTQDMVTAANVVLERAKVGMSQTPTTKPAPLFPVGSTVCHRSFTDSGGKHHDAVTGLQVVESRLIEPGSIPSYYRVKAVGLDGRGYVEAAERFFEAEA
jgi:hypothetical protein